MHRDVLQACRGSAMVFGHAEELCRSQLAVSRRIPMILRAGTTLSQIHTIQHKATRSHLMASGAQGSRDRDLSATPKLIEKGLQGAIALKARVRFSEETAAATTRGI